MQQCPRQARSHQHPPGLKELALLDLGQRCAVAEHSAKCIQADVCAIVCKRIHWHQKLQGET